LNIIGGNELNRSVIILQDGLGTVSLLGKRYGAPLGHTRASDGGSITVFRIKGFLSARFDNIYIKYFVNKLADVFKNISSPDKILIISGRTGNVEFVMAAPIPFSIEGDLGVNVCLQRVSGPSRINFRGCHVFDIPGKCFGHVGGSGIGRP
jgi:hypothetical protein